MPASYDGSHLSRAGPRVRIIDRDSSKHSTVSANINAALLWRPKSSGANFSSRRTGVIFDLCLSIAGHAHTRCCVCIHVLNSSRLGPAMTDEVSRSATELVGAYLIPHADAKHVGRCVVGVRNYQDERKRQKKVTDPGLPRGHWMQSYDAQRNKSRAASYASQTKSTLINERACLVGAIPCPSAPGSVDQGPGTRRVRFATSQLGSNSTQSSSLYWALGSSSGRPPGRPPGHHRGFFPAAAE
ncbi:hypothetical protein F5B22DRAFT_169948 [Xylaria bambusicola]|uniref:uncharacterized protein n=1 Tax=Xylaria bambusicola TaxID=326684 RepID=UPI002007CC24|nr:uncharacterized protein F5B22DRAFT_169948 [Xylaria bambusicola]KAI0526647.1 hypothetical protein F5B22DRAFT_169948 [Xylaria bambusicola]